jgi:MFS family permease
MADNDRRGRLFLGCFIALVATAFGFIGRVFLISNWAVEFDLNQAEAGRLAGIGIWPFAVSIIGFSLFIDRIGYKTAMLLAFFGHTIWAVMGVSAFFVSQGGNKDLAFSLLYWGSLILGLANGTVEAFINPVVATVYSDAKTKWLNILHAAWPGGLVLAGMLTIFLGSFDWWIKIALIMIPVLVYFVMLIPIRFPVQERVASGVSYRDMLAEFGVLGAIVVGALVTLQLMDFYSVGSTVELTTNQQGVFVAIGVAIVVAFGLYTRALGRGILFVLVLIMMPLATTEIGTDAWITGIMEGVLEMTPAEIDAAGGMENVRLIDGRPLKLHPGWVLVYTSAIMMVLRFFAGPLVHKLSPLGLLSISAILAIAGLYWLSLAAGAAILGAATLYGLGKTFFWPTMLGVVAEQTPRGGALTLNAISGIGMLTAGTLGTAYIGALQERSEVAAFSAQSELVDQIPGLMNDGQLTVLEDRTIYEVIGYQVVSDDKLNELVVALPDDEEAAVTQEIAQIRKHSGQAALAKMALFPAIMLVGYLVLIAYFRSRGGYQAEVLTGHAADDEKFTGGTAGPGEG